MASLTVENYVKAVFHLCERAPSTSAATGQVAAALSVSPGTVTSMLKTLSEAGLASYTPYEGVQLTDAGRQLALRLIRRHRLVELFLTKTLNLAWDQVHEDAEQMEHVLSDLLVDRIDAHLGHPLVDPHGDPIPQPDGSIPRVPGQALLQCSAGQRFRLVRVTDQSCGFLQFLSQSGLTLGTVGRMVTTLSPADTLTVEVNGQETSLGRHAAECLLVVDPDVA